MVSQPRCHGYLDSVLIACCIIFSCAALSSCTVSERVTYTDSEAQLPDDFLSQLKPNKTSKRWVTSRLDEPRSVTQGPLDEEVYTYDLTENRFRHKSVFLVIRYSQVEEDEAYLHVMFKDELVQKRWYSKTAIVEDWRFSKPKTKKWWPFSKSKSKRKAVAVDAEPVGEKVLNEMNMELDSGGGTDESSEERSGPASLQTSSEEHEYQ